MVSMSDCGRAIEFLDSWRRGFEKPHSKHGWGEDECNRCIADAYDSWMALIHAARIAGLINDPASPPSIEQALQALDSATDAYRDALDREASR